MMLDRVKPGPVCDKDRVKEAVCINTSKIYDSCRSKECITDLRLYPTRCSQAIIDRATSVKPKTAELLWTYVDVESIVFNKGFYTVDITFFYRVVCEVFCGVGKGQEVVGLCSFDKRVILFGSEGSARVFTSQYRPGSCDDITTMNTNYPRAVVEVVDPVCLGAKLRENCHHHHHCCNDVPKHICGCFDDDIIMCDDNKTIFVTLGQFSIVRLERDVQLLIPAYDFCIPHKECPHNNGNGIDEPCDVFERFAFPVEQFFPPQLDACNKDSGYAPSNSKSHTKDCDRSNKCGCPL